MRLCPGTPRHSAGRAATINVPASDAATNGIQRAAPNSAPLTAAAAPIDAVSAVVKKPCARPNVRAVAV